MSPQRKILSQPGIWYGSKNATSAPLIVQIICCCLTLCQNQSLCASSEEAISPIGTPPPSTLRWPLFPAGCETRTAHPIRDGNAVYEHKPVLKQHRYVRTQRSTSTHEDVCSPDYEFHHLCHLRSQGSAPAGAVPRLRGPREGRTRCWSLRDSSLGALSRAVMLRITVTTNTGCLHVSGCPPWDTALCSRDLHTST